MIINWYGEGCFKIQMGDFTLVTDSFDSKLGLNPARGKFDVSLKTISAWPIKEEKEEDSAVLIGPGEYEIKGFEIKGISLKKQSSDSFFKTIYLVKIEDTTLCFLGHISDYPDENVLEELESIDILFIPAGGTPFIKQELAAKLVKQINPKIIIPTFFKVPGLKRQTASIKDFADDLGIKPEQEDKLTIKKKDLIVLKSTKLVQLKV
ncbi:MBL fold metallo-hydrolase [Patescibacteria group bacterium]|nr:MBL fold metallo-hydrolase [Patescibacteria group bacterium]